MDFLCYKNEYKKASIKNKTLRLDTVAERRWMQMAGGGGGGGGRNQMDRNNETLCAALNRFKLKYQWE